VSGSLRLAVVAWPVSDVSSRLVSHEAVVCAAALPTCDDAVSRSLAHLSPDERARHAAYTNAIVARRYAGGRVLLREILGCALGMAPGCIPLVEGVHGKPALARRAVVRPLWFSVAHCEDILLVAMSRSAEVGVDVERVRSIEQWERVADRVLDPAERSQLRRAVAGGEEPGRAFLRHWCRVEAELKAIGCGIAGLEEHLAGKRPLGLRLADLAELPLPASVTAGGARYHAAVALCSPGVESARQSALAANQAESPTIPPARASRT
jgi:phosphopantetheinyl transferase